MIRSSKLLIKTIFILFILITTYCSSEDDLLSDESKKFVDLSIIVNKNDDFPKNIYHAVAQVSAPDIDTLRYHYFPTEDTSDWILKKIPKGNNRKIKIIGYDEKESKIYEGETNNDIGSNIDSTFKISLYNNSSKTEGQLFYNLKNYVPQKDKILFAADYNGSLDIYAMDSLGRGIQQLTSSKYTDYVPRMSADEKKIIFIRILEEKYRPFVINIDGTNIHQLNFAPELSIAFCDWSKDGRKILFHAKDNDELARNLYIYDSKSKVVTLLLDNSATNYRPKWMPGEDKIVFYSDITGIFRLYFFDLNNNFIELISNTYNFEEKVPDPSPDGKKLVFSGREKESDFGIFMIDIDGTGLRKVIHENVDEHVPAFSPDGKHIVFQRRTESHSNGIYSIDTSGHNLKKVLDTKYNEQNAHWR